jgi:ABC-type dipeptide/oligopeptide/nickel transport system ATPase component
MLLSVRICRSVSKRRICTVHAVNGVSFDLDASETLGIVGKSGCGKSAASPAITRLLPRTHAMSPAAHPVSRCRSDPAMDREMRKLRGRHRHCLPGSDGVAQSVLTIGRH